MRFAKIVAAIVLVVAVVDVGVVSSASICSNPEHYVGQSLCDPWGTYCGECVSFIKVCTGKKILGFEPWNSWFLKSAFFKVQDIF